MQVGPGLTMQQLELTLVAWSRPKKTCLFPISYLSCSVTCYSKFFLGVWEVLEKIPPKHMFLVILHLIIMFFLIKDVP